MISGIQGFSNFDVNTINQMREKMFNRLDSDGDGQIGLDGIKSKIQEAGIPGSHRDRLVNALNKADTDGNGQVSRNEFKKMPGPPPPPPPGGSGQNGFSLFLEELNAADSDSNGVIKGEEFSQIYSDTGDVSNFHQRLGNLINQLG